LTNFYSIIDTVFEGKVVNELEFGGYKAVTPRVQGTFSNDKVTLAGNAFITGKNEFYIYKDDDLKEGFLLR
jgi:proline racemase/trans-L-3-hydroxyproline dehydratase